MEGYKLGNGTGHPRLRAARARHRSARKASHVEMGVEIASSAFYSHMRPVSRGAELTEFVYKIKRLRYSKGAHDEK